MLIAARGSSLLRGGRRGDAGFSVFKGLLSIAVAAPPENGTWKLGGGASGYRA